MSEQQLWYVAPHGNQIGPIPRSEVESMLRNGSPLASLAGASAPSRARWESARGELLRGTFGGADSRPAGRTI